MSSRKSRGRRVGAGSSPPNCGGPTTLGRLGKVSGGTLPRYALVFGLALAARLAAIVSLERVPLWRTPSLDSLEYLQLAGRIQDLSWPAYAPHAPGYPAFIAGLMALHCSLIEIRIVQACLAAVTCVLTARLAAHTLDKRAFLPTGLLMALYGPLVVTDVAMLAEGPFLLTLAIALTLAVAANDRAIRWVAAGIAIGVASLIRPTALALLPVYAAILLWQWRRRPGALTSVACLLAGAAIAIAPLVWHNWREGRVVNVQGWGAMNIYIGNAPHGTGRASVRPGPAWDELEGAAGRAGFSTPQESESYYLHRTLAEIREAPGAYLGLLGRKALWLVQAEEIRDTHSLYFFTAAVPPLEWLPGFGVLFALAAAGTIECAKRSLSSPWIAGYLAGMGLTCFFLVVGSRYRLPLIPALAIYAGSGVMGLIDAFRLERWRAFATGCVAAVIVFLVAHAKVDAASHQFAEEWTLTAEGLVRQNDLSGAAAASRRAIDLDPRSSFALDELGWVEFLEGRVEIARSTLARATTLGPTYASAWYHLGRVEQSAGDHQAAIEAFQRSLAVAPERLPATEALGQELLAANRLPEAEPLLQKVADRSPDNGTAHFGLALIALNEGRTAEAVTEAGITARLLPSYGRAWLLLARAEVAGGQSDAAERALSNAEQLGSDRREVIAGRAKILLMRGDTERARALVLAAAGGDTAVAATIWRDVESW